MLYCVVHTVLGLEQKKILFKTFNTNTAKTALEGERAPCSQHQLLDQKGVTLHLGIHRPKSNFLYVAFQ